MDKSKLLLFVALLAVGAGLYFKSNQPALDQFRNALSKVLPVATPASPETPSEANLPPASGASAQAQSAVENYMHRNAVPGCTLSFLEWSDFSTSGPTAAITLRYRVQALSRPDLVATVRFTIQGGSVVKADLVQPAAPPASAVAIAPVQRPVQTPMFAPRPMRPPVVIDHFSSALFAAEHGGTRTLYASSAFSLSELDQAKAKAQAEHKPLGFIMVWGQFFGKEADTRSNGSESALVHFYEVFHQQLVLVFVRHETELSHVPPAVSRGFSGADEGGFAPNMSVVDATATEFIVEIPFRNLDGPGRDPIFAAGGRKIDQWLATHPDAVPTPAP